MARMYINAFDTLHSGPSLKIIAIYYGDYVQLEALFLLKIFFVKIHFHQMSIKIVWHIEQIARTPPTKEGILPLQAVFQTKGEQ